MVLYHATERDSWSVKVKLEKVWKLFIPNFLFITVIERPIVNWNISNNNLYIS